MKKEFNILDYVDSPKVREFDIKEQYNVPKDVAQNLMNIHYNIIDKIYEHFEGCVIVITSGYRCPRLNAIVGGSKNSQHTRGEAVDLVVYNKGINITDQVFHYIKDNLEFDQLIWERGSKSMPQWIHVSLKRNGQNRKQVLYMYARTN
jgi:hypothetical protein